MTDPIIAIRRTPLIIGYLHDGGPNYEAIKLTKEDAPPDKCYAYVISFSDPTDYARFPDWLYWAWANTIASELGE